MTQVKAGLFNILFYGMFIGYMIVFLFLFLFPARTGFGAVRNLMRNELRLQRLFGLKLEVRGREHVPTGGGLIAAKHQSMWETFSLVALVPEPVFIYKQELGKLPLFGAYLRKFGMIPVDRKGGSAALRAMADASRAAVDMHRQVLIFPEGTRREAGAEPAYKFGVAKMYAEIGLPVTPMVLNSGLFWSNFFWRGHPGTIIVEFLPPIEPGLPAPVFFERLQRNMEAATDRLLVETASGPNPPPLSEIARKRVEAAKGAGA